MSRRARIAILAVPIAFLLVFFVYPFVSIVWEGLGHGSLARSGGCSARRGSAT